MNLYIMRLLIVMLLALPRGGAASEYIEDKAWNYVNDHAFTYIYVMCENSDKVMAEFGQYPEEFRSDVMEWLNVYNSETDSGYIVFVDTNCEMHVYQRIGGHKVRTVPTEEVLEKLDKECSLEHLYKEAD